MNYWENFILGLIFASMTVLAAAEQVDKVVAIVNNEVVLESDIQNILNRVKFNARHTSQKTFNDTLLRKQILDHLIIDSIILQTAKQMQIDIPEKIVNDTIVDIAHQNNLTLEKMKAHLKTDGITMEEYRRDIRKEILIAEVRNNEVRRRVSILPKEVELLAKQISAQPAYQTNVNLSYILIPLPEYPTSEKLQQSHEIVNKVMNELKKGISLNRLSITSSVESQRLKVIKMGWSNLQDLPSILSKALQNSKKNDVIGPIRSNLGYYVLHVDDIKSINNTTSVTEVKVRHILLKSSPILSDIQAYQKLTQICQDIYSGRITFENAAKKFSEDLDSALKGGDLGWNMAEIYDPVFRDALIKLKKGEISRPILSKFGWHLIQLQDTRNIDKTDSVQKNQAYRLLFDRKFNEESKSWVEEQKAAAYINIIDADS
ncbi:Chaperone SurA [Candidatus Hartigia pinicola]|nr:Chaperone SurA [Candidatus Hartigia pinicola]